MATNPRATNQSEASVSAVEEALRADFDGDEGGSAAPRQRDAAPSGPRDQRAAAETPRRAPQPQSERPRQAGPAPRRASRQEATARAEAPVESTRADILTERPVTSRSKP